MKTFQQALEKRANSKSANFDRHMLQKVTQDVIEEMLGKVGLQNVQVVCQSEEEIILKAEKSAWRSELILNQQAILEEIKTKTRTIGNPKITIRKN